MKTMTTSIDKLLDYMFDQNSKLTDQLAGVREELRLQREQADRHHRDFKSSPARMEERAIAAERRADKETEASEKAEELVADLMRIIDSFVNGSVRSTIRTCTSIQRI